MASTTSNAPTTLKLLLIGSSSVGKSSLLLRFTDETFLSPEETSATIGVDFKVKNIIRDGKRYKLSIWDTAGQERFRTLTSAYYRGAHAVIVVYDVTNRETFDSLPSWFGELSTFVSDRVVRAVVGNKVDKEFARTVPRAEAEAFVSSLSPPCKHFECSAKKNQGVDEVFDAAVDTILQDPELLSSALPIAQRRLPGAMPGAGGGQGANDTGTVSLSDEDGGWGVGRYCAC